MREERNNVAVLKIFYSDMTYDKVEEIIPYNFYDVIGECLWMPAGRPTAKL